VSDDTCILEGCGNKKNKYGRGRCGRHYAEGLKDGSLPRIEDLRPKQCTAAGCQAAVFSRGYCAKHWNRWRRHGDPDAYIRKRGRSTCTAEEGCTFLANSNGRCTKHDARFRKYGTVVLPDKDDPMERFRRSVDMSSGPDGCHVWTGKGDKDGYGKFGFNNRAHRWILGQLRGKPLESSEWALHHCDNPPCVNPAHLYVGTALENARDKLSRGRHRRIAGHVRCRNGHLYPQNPPRSADGARICPECAARRGRGITTTEWNRQPEVA
jgi:hypothetical protein